MMQTLSLTQSESRSEAERHECEILIPVTLSPVSVDALDGVMEGELVFRVPSFIKHGGDGHLTGNGLRRCHHTQEGGQDGPGHCDHYHCVCLSVLSYLPILTFQQRVQSLSLSHIMLSPVLRPGEDWTLSSLCPVTQGR